MAAAVRAIAFHRRVLVSAPPFLPDIQSFGPLQLGSAHSKVSLMASAASADMAYSTAAYRAEAPAGAVECYARGCRPVYDEDEACHASYASEYDGGREAESVTGLMAWQGLRHHPAGCQMEQLLGSGGAWAGAGAEAEVERYYESALRMEPHNALLLLEYALFTWNGMADARRAEGLFQRALRLAPSNPSFLASYASFLWQSETQ